MSDHKDPEQGTDPTSISVVAALEDDPFYVSITGSYAMDISLRRTKLARYFSYSIDEGSRLGRCVFAEGPARGVAVWLLPQTAEIESRAAADKQVFLRQTLDNEGCANYYRIVDFMSARAATLVDDDSWYLSILAVDPALQGRGLGRKLLEPTLAEADRLSTTCYLETFSTRNTTFYNRAGFAVKARFEEPTTRAEYAVMVRYPSPRADFA
jgi:GNAT superfamily N-acetyltransferase